MFHGEQIKQAIRKGLFHEEQSLSVYKSVTQKSPIYSTTTHQL